MYDLCCQIEFDRQTFDVVILQFKCQFKKNKQTKNDNNNNSKQNAIKIQKKSVKFITYDINKLAILMAHTTFIERK